MEKDGFSQIEEMFLANQRPMMAVALRILHDREAARDALQETFIKFVKFLRETQTQPDHSWHRAWLFRTLKNNCIDRLRTRRRHGEVALDAHNDSRSVPGPDAELIRQEKVGIVIANIAELNSRQREALLLKYKHHKSYREIAELLETTVGNVGFILHQALKSLKDQLATEYKSDELF
jgi:RNA polymerase sigma-70 factor (ECF subfamily)